MLASRRLAQARSDGTLLPRSLTARRRQRRRLQPRRGGRAVDRAGLENRKAERSREFESHPLRAFLTAHAYFLQTAKEPPRGEAWTALCEFRLFRLVEPFRDYSTQFGVPAWLVQAEHLLSGFVRPVLSQLQRALQRRSPAFLLSCVL